MAMESLTPQLEKGDHFLSATNPVANVDQRDLEALAIKVVNQRAVRDVRDRVAGLWRAIVGKSITSAKASETFEDFIDTWMFHWALKATNSDPNYPRVVYVEEYAHEWFDMHVPSARFGGDNPDNRYAWVPFDNLATYVLSGQVLGLRPADEAISLYADTVPVFKLEHMHGNDLMIGADGRFTITVAPEAPGDGSNHLRSGVDTRVLFTRHSMGDWAREVPMALRVERVDPPSAPPLTIDQVAARAASWACLGVAPMSYYASAFGRMTPNEMSPVAITPGGLTTQVTSFGNVEIKDDEALVVTVTSGNAAYYSMALHDFCKRTLDGTDHIISMNHAQADHNKDGSVTYVISVKDPGVYNWLETMGWNQVYTTHRWQGLPVDQAGAYAEFGDDKRSSAENLPTIDARLVNLSDLREVLPPETRWVDSKERDEQRSQRRADYLSRWRVD